MPRNSYFCFNFNAISALYPNNKHTKDANEKHSNLRYCIPDINNEYQTKCNMNVNAHASARDIVYD